MKLLRRIKRWLKSLISKPKPAKPIQVTPAKPRPIKEPTKGRVQRFPKNYEYETQARYDSMIVGEGLLGRQNKGHIEWYKKRLLHGKARYEKASNIVRLKTGYDIPWQIIGVIHGMEAGFDFNKQILTNSS